MDSVRTLHVARVFEAPIRGGIELAALTAAVHSPSGILCFGAQDGEHQGVAVYRVRSWTPFVRVPFSLWFLIRFMWLMRRHDVAHLHTPCPAVEMLGWLTRKPVVVSYHADVCGFGWADRVYAFWLRLCAHRWDVVISATPTYQASSPVLSRLTLDQRVVPYGVEPTTPVPQELNECAQLPEQFLLFIGSLRRYKGLSTLVAASRLVDFPIVIAGHGECADQLVDRPDNLIWLGAVSDAQKHALIARSHGVVLPSTSRAEAFGIVLIEAMMHARPVIATQMNSGPDWLVEPGVNGLLVEPGDAPALAQAMQALWRDPAQAREMGINGQGRFAKEFTADRYRTRLNTLYAELRRQPARQFG